MPEKPASGASPFDPEPLETAKVDRSFSRRLLLQVGQAGMSEPNTIASNWDEHWRQRYSKSGMRFISTGGR